MVTRILLALLAFVCSGGLVLEPAIAETPKTEAAFAALTAAANALEPYTDGAYLDRKAGAGPALDQFRTAAQHWVVAYLNRHPQATLTALEAAAPKFFKEESLSAVRLTPSLIAVSVHYAAFGNVFLVEQKGAQFALVWDIRQGGPSNPCKNAWLTDAAFGDASGSCCQCRALNGEIRLLPPDAAGHARFLIEGYYAQPAGATMGSQISIWRWTGKSADLLLAKDFVSVADDHPVIDAAGAILTVRIKDQYRMLFACGACSGRTLYWTLKVTPDGIDDAGTKPAIPEADVVDEAFYRLWHGQDASSLAAPEVVQQMAQLVISAKADKRNGDGKYPSLGMLMEIAVFPGRPVSGLTFTTDIDGAGQLLFQVQHKKSGYYLTKLEIPPQK